MAGARKKPSKKGGSFQGFYKDHTGRRVFFTGTQSRSETKQIARDLEAEHRKIALGVKPAPTALARHRKRPFAEIGDEYLTWGRMFGRNDGKPWTAEHAACKAKYLKGWAETLSLETLGDLDLQNHCVSQRWKQTKNKKPATCYLPGKLAVTLAQFAESGAPRRLYEQARNRPALPEAPLLFVPTHLLRLFNADLQKAQIPKENREGRLDFHALRASAVTLAADAGANVKALQQYARHSDLRLTLGLYAKARDFRMAERAEKTGGALPISGMESATEVHFNSTDDDPIARNSLLEPALSSPEQERGLCLGGIGRWSAAGAAWGSGTPQHGYDHAEFRRVRGATREGGLRWAGGRFLCCSLA